MSQFICIEKENEKKVISIVEFEQIMRVPFISSLEFERPSDLQKILKMTAKLHKKQKLSRQQLWLGSYYKKEISSQCIPKVVLRYINPLMGWGVFADQDFKKGEFIAEYSGIVRKRRRHDRKNAYCFEYLLAPDVPSPFLIDAQNQGGIARYINHSHQANLLPSLATFDSLTHVVLIAAEPISRGTQLCYDYGSDYWAHRESPRIL